MQARAPERERMVREQIEGRGITEPRVVEAMRAVPREHFMPPEAAGQAYADAACPIACGQTISQPFMVACMTAALQLGGDERVLELGTGSGYQTALLARLARRIYTVEWHLPLLNRALDCCTALGLTNITGRCGDGSLGWDEHAPYDAILVTAGAPHVPAALREQLAEGGRLVIPVGNEYEQTLIVARKQGGELVETPGVRCRFVRLLGRDAWHE